MKYMFFHVKGTDYYIAISSERYLNDNNIATSEIYAEIYKEGSSEIMKVDKKGFRILQTGAKISIDKRKYKEVTFVRIYNTQINRNGIRIFTNEDYSEYPIAVEIYLPEQKVDKVWVLDEDFKVLKTNTKENYEGGDMNGRCRHSKDPLPHS